MNDILCVLLYSGLSKFTMCFFVYISDVILAVLDAAAQRILLLLMSIGSIPRWEFARAIQRNVPVTMRFPMRPRSVLQPPRNFVFRTLGNKVTSPNAPVGTGRTSQGKRKVRKGANLLTFRR